MTVTWFDESSVPREAVGGKAVSLHRLASTGVSVPHGFTIGTAAYQRFIEENGLVEEIARLSSTEGADSAAADIREQISGGTMPEETQTEIRAAHTELTEQQQSSVAVRSSATAEDMDDASFAGQQETYLNVGSDQLLSRVKDCWASLFTDRVVQYRASHDISHEDALMGVVVQTMIEADKSGVVFTREPTTGDMQMIIESAWGLGESVVSGEVSPDKYVFDRDSETIAQSTVNTKEIMIERGTNGDSCKVAVPDDKQTVSSLSEDEIAELTQTAERIEQEYQTPQDIEWSLSNGELYILQSRPITTITTDMTEPNSNADETEVLVEGLSASPGTNAGSVTLVSTLDELDRVQSGDILVTEMTTPDMVPAMQRADGIVTDHGGMTSHAAIVSRELGIPAVVGCGTATDILNGGDAITVNGERGVVTTTGHTDSDAESDAVEQMRPTTPVTPMTATEVKVNVSLPQAAECAAATGADGVGLLRIEHMILGLQKTPEKYIADHGREAFVQELVDSVQQVAEEFYARSVRVRTLDAPTDEFQSLEGGDDEPDEHNPMLGYRGTRRSLKEPAVFDCQLEAFARLYEMGYDNLEIMFPLITDADDVKAVKTHMETAGIDTERRRWGVMIETPASALQTEQMIGEGIDFVSFGTNDLTQYMLALDRNNSRVADRFNASHPAVRSVISNVIETCQEHDIDSSICGEAASQTEMVDFLVREGITSISANIDAVRDVQHEAKRIEQKLVLEDIRE